MQKESFDRISLPALRRLQMRLCGPSARQQMAARVARQQVAKALPWMGFEPAAVPALTPSQVRARWFAERERLGTPLSDDELRHGVRMGLIASVLLQDEAV